MVLRKILTRKLIQVKESLMKVIKPKIEELEKVVMPEEVWKTYLRVLVRV